MLRRRLGCLALLTALCGSRRSEWRLDRNATAAASLISEALLLERLSDTVTAPLPVPFHVTGRFSLHRMLHGAITTRSSLTKSPPVARERLIDEVGRLLGELGDTDPTGVAASPAMTSKERLDQLRADVDMHVAPLPLQHQREWIDALFELNDQFSFNSSPCVINDDLVPYQVRHDTHRGIDRRVRLRGRRSRGQRHRPLPTVRVSLHRCCRSSGQLLRSRRDFTDMAVAHLGHIAFEIAPFSEPF